MASKFDKIKKNLKKGIEERVAVVKEGADAVSGKMGELTAEGKRQCKIFDLKAKIQRQMAVLGVTAYDVLDGNKSPAAFSKVKTAFAKIKKLETQLGTLEGKKETSAAAPVKPARKAKATPKKNAQASTKKTAPKVSKKARD